MANIIRKENNNQNISTGLGRWEPFRLMQEMLGWDPFRQIAPFVGTAGGGFMPAFEIKETPEAYVFTGDLPGIKDEDLNVSLSGNTLTISGKREEEKKKENDTYYTCERSYGAFSRAFTLPAGANGDQIQAEMKEGVLTVHIPKKPEVQPKKITVKNTQEKKA